MMEAGGGAALGTNGAWQALMQLSGVLVQRNHFPSRHQRGDQTTFK